MGLQRSTIQISGTGTGKWTGAGKRTQKAVARLDSSDCTLRPNEVETALTRRAEPLFATEVCGRKITIRQGRQNALLAQGRGQGRRKIYAKPATLRQYLPRRRMSRVPLLFLALVAMRGPITLTFRSWSPLVMPRPRSCGLSQVLLQDQFGNLTSAQDPANPIQMLVSEEEGPLSITFAEPERCCCTFPCRGMASGLMCVGGQWSGMSAHI